MKNKMIILMCLILTLTACAPHHRHEYYYDQQSLQHHYDAVENHSTQRQVEKYVGGALYGIPLGMGILVMVLLAAGG